LPEESEKLAKKYYDSLQEKDKRRYAGTLYQMLGRGSNNYICELLGISYKTIKKGLLELMQDDLPNPSRQRRKGGGRDTKWDKKELNDAFANVMENFTAGDPMDESIKYTNFR
jgi:hypothetical protein